jgi:hypothetical protein
LLIIGFRRCMTLGPLKYLLSSNVQLFCKSILFHWSIYVCVRTIVEERQDTIGVRGSLKGTVGTWNRRLIQDRS